MFKLFKNRKPVVYIFFGIYLFLIGIIIFESCLRTSKNVINDEFFANIYAYLSNSGNSGNESNVITFNDFVNKFAGHMAFFFLAAVIGFVFFLFLFEEKEHKLIIAMCASISVSFVIAGVSELIQYFVPSRNANFIDVLTDFLGALIGIMICLMVYGIVRLIQKTNENKEQTEEK